MQPIATFEPSEQWDPEGLDTLEDRLTETFPTLSPKTIARIADIIDKATKAEAEALCAEMFGHFLRRIYSSEAAKDPRLIALAFAANLDEMHEFRTMLEAAKSINMTKARISQMSIALRESLQIRTGNHQRSNEARVNMALAQHRIQECRQRGTQGSRGRGQEQTGTPPGKESI